MHPPFTSIHYAHHSATFSTSTPFSTPFHIHPPTLPIPIPQNHLTNPIHPIPISWDAASHRPPGAAGALATASCGTAWPPPPARPPRCAAGGAWPSPRPPRGAPPSRDAESGLGAAGRRGGLGIGSGGVDLGWPPNIWEVSVDVSNFMWIPYVWIGRIGCMNDQPWWSTGLEGSCTILSALITSSCTETVKHKPSSLLLVWCSSSRDKEKNNFTSLPLFRTSPKA